ncbi:MAG TPA: zinc ribbon domain-containing protein [Thermoplasmata archaeon]
MADPIVDNIVIAVIVLVLVLGVLTFIELKYLRKASRGRRARAASASDLPDQAHNAILTSKAISRTLSAAGVVTADVDAVVQEAQVAYRNRNYRVVIELTDKAKSMLKTEKARHDRMGDLSRLRKTAGSEAEEATTKEYIQKELPPNYMQARFTISLAEERITAARDAGRATPEAEAVLATARQSFDGKDFDGALKLAAKSRRLADGEAEPGVPPGSPAASAPVPATVELPRPAGRACASCGSELLAGDPFCRKCGVKVERPTTCAKCGASLKEDDTFCRKCGAAIA